MRMPKRPSTTVDGADIGVIAVTGATEAIAAIAIAELTQATWSQAF